jgi:hypothetical protein
MTDVAAQPIFRKGRELKWLPHGKEKQQGEIFAKLPKPRSASGLLLIFQKEPGEPWASKPRK